ALPVGEDAGGSVGQALPARRLDVVAPAPEVDLLRAEALGGLRLVQALEVAVHALVQRRVALGRRRADPGDLERETGGLGRAHEDRRVQLVDPASAELLTRVPGFALAARREGHVDPAREAVLEVPLRLSVAEKDQLRHGATCGGSLTARRPRMGA